MPTTTTTQTTTRRKSKTPTTFGTFVKNTKTNRRAGRRITETEVAELVVEVLHDQPNRRATISELLQLIPQKVALSMADLVRSPSRPNEAIWMQQVRNIASHRESPGNAVFEGQLRKVKNGFALPKRRAA